MAIAETFDFFFDLPGELREQILGHLLVKPDGIKFGSFPEAVPHPVEYSENDGSDDDQDRCDRDDSPSWPLNYFLVSQTFNREATAIYFRENTFYLWASGRKRAGTTRGFDSQAMKSFEDTSHSERRKILPAICPAACEVLLNTPEWARSRERIRSIVLYIGRPRGALDQNVFQPLSDMILAGGLKSLEVRMYDYSSRPVSFLASIPMQWLYRLLSDPDLDEARLRTLFLDTRHYPTIWCPFLKGGEHVCENHASVGLQPDERSKRAARFTEPDARWFDLDVEALIQKHGAVEEQMRIFKVGD